MSFYIVSLETKWNVGMILPQKGKPFIPQQHHLRPFKYSFPTSFPTPPQVFLMAPSTDLVDFCVRLPKVELHAHINGSISPKTMHQLMDRKRAMGTLNEELAAWQVPDSLERIHEYVHILHSNDEAWILT